MNFAVEECAEQSWWEKKAFELTLHACAEDEQELGKNSSILCILYVSGLEEKE